MLSLAGGSVSRSVMAVTIDLDREFSASARRRTRSACSTACAPFRQELRRRADQLAEEQAGDAAVREADTLLLTVPDILGVEYHARLPEAVAHHVAPAIGWVCRGSAG